MGGRSSFHWWIALLGAACTVDDSRAVIVPAEAAVEAATSILTNPARPAWCGPFNGYSFDSVGDASPCDLRVFRDHSVCWCTAQDLDCGPHGACQILQNGAPPSCYCYFGYSGERCTECPAGNVITDRGCETPCAVTGLTCFYGGCSADGTQCECNPGYAGEHCDRCAPQFQQDFVFPNPDGDPLMLCTPMCQACAPDESCAPTTPPSCACRSAYVRTDGVCTYRGNDLALPASTEECGNFRFYTEPSPSQALADVGAKDGVLFLKGPRCHLASAVTVVNFPAATTLPNPALRIRFLGTKGLSFKVQIGGEPESYSDYGVGSIALASTGLDQTEVICLGYAAGERATLKLWFKDSDNACIDEMVEVDVRELAFVTSDTCRPPQDAGND